MPIYEYLCPDCGHRFESFYISQPVNPGGSVPCLLCAAPAGRIMSPAVVRSVEHKGTPYQHLYDDTVTALGIEDFAAPKPKSDDSDWTQKYDPSWEDDE